MRKGNIDKTAIALGISQRRVHGLVAEGVLPKPRNGRHNIAKCRVLYETYLRRTNKAYRIQCEREEFQRRLDAGLPVAWSVELAAEEFGVSEKRIREGLRRIHAKPVCGPDEWPKKHHQFPRGTRSGLAHE
jgi:hypothetical protein